jgi:hypothetical protein
MQVTYTPKAVNFQLPQRHFLSLKRELEAANFKAKDGWNWSF